MLFEQKITFGDLYSAKAGHNWFLYILFEIIVNYAVEMYQQ